MDDLARTDDDTVPDEELWALLEYLKRHRGVDFTGYKPAGLRRRILRRMRAVELAGFADYLAHLTANPDELASLLDTVLINVTSFFRDPDAWQFVAGEIVPRLLRDRAPDGPIRVWSAGCASGQEPFTAAMVLAEAMGLDSFCRRVKIYATDLDEPALQQAWRASYPVAELDAVPEALRARYFDLREGAAALHNSLRRAVIFGRHDLLEDAPISRIDLLLCRNTLMYFSAAAQARILGRLHFSLAERGYIMLGRAEMLLSHADSFAPVELRHRIFAKLPADARWDDRRFLSAQQRREEQESRHVRLREAALDASPAAQLVLDGKGQLALVNERARLMFRLGPPDLGRPLQDLELSYRPVDLRSMMDEAHEQRRPVHREGVERKIAEQDSQYLDVVITPMFRDGAVTATIITFSDVTHHRQLQENLQRFSESLETAYEELQSANDELETTNEELQSANEEPRVH